VRLVVPRSPPVIDRVEVAETRFVSPDAIRSGIRQREGEPLDAQALAHDLVREFSQGDLSSLDYSVMRERDRTILRVTPVEKPWGPDYLRFGFNLSSDFRSESRFNVRALYRRTWLNTLGAEWLLGAQIGSEQSIATELYQPLDRRHVFFVRPLASAGLRKVPLYFEGDRLAVYRVQENRAGLEGGADLGVNGRASAGWVERHIGAVLDTGPDSFFNVTQRVGGPTAALVIDTYDQPFFPTHGMKLDASYFDATHASSGLAPYSKGEARWGGAYSVGRWTALAGLEGGTTFKGTLPLGDAFSLGGPRRLTGFADDQMLGGDYSLGRLEAQYRLSYNSPLFGLTLLAGVMGEAGRMNKPFTETSLNGWQRSFSAYLAASTFLGPIYVGVADAKNGKARFYLFIGTP
jgi:NTE family protein